MGRKSESMGSILGVLLVVSLLGAGIYFATTQGCVQSRSWSRISGKALKLTLPEDFARPISFSTGREGEKDLFYESTSGEFKVKTYTHSGLWEAEIDFEKAK